MTRWLLPAAAVAVGALALAACSSSGSPPAGRTSVTAVTSSASSSAAPPTSPAVSTPDSTDTSVRPVPSETASASPRPSHSRSRTRTRTSQPPSTSVAPPPPPTTSPPPPTTSHPSTTPAPPSGPQPCTADELHTDGVRGGASQGQEFAGVLFVNASHTTCTLQGYIFARLRYHKAMLGKPATHDPGAQRLIKMHPGDSAEVTLTAVSTCQAPLSDHVLVRVPGDSTAIVVALQLRGCALSVGPITPA